MAFLDLLDHRCEIYHLKRSEGSLGYGLPSAVTFNYSDIADEVTGCHFGMESLETSVSQHSPQNIFKEKIKLTLPITVDVRMNDKIIDCDTGLEYTAERPRNIRNHHAFVYIKRIKQQEAL